MAQKVQIVLEDDISGGPADETVNFCLDGVSYEIDLTAANAAELRDALGPWIVAARKTPVRNGGRRRRAAAPAGASAATIRLWAAENGVPVPDRGRIPAAVREQYEAATK
ncbi:histone-like nucleoid-structuring protein Lsr2 [Demequina pelophila]|uniref:histone-like nucleoid-structuring protein Lsr2 n=1 Tax=Demequina pelophila TaxID=1638984 RepID=UPI0007831217|nr:Lsr2 family protein [Demequina pelophila]